MHDRIIHNGDHAEIHRLRAVEAEQAARIAARDARIAALEAGLRPFAEAAASITASLPGWDDDDAVLAEWEPWEGPDAKLTFGQFREATRLLNLPQEGR